MNVKDVQGAPIKKTIPQEKFNISVILIDFVTKFTCFTSENLDYIEESERKTTAVPRRWECGCWKRLEVGRSGQNFGSNTWHQVFTSYTYVCCYI